MNERMNKWKKQRKNERVNERMNAIKGYAPAQETARCFLSRVVCSTACHPFHRAQHEYIYELAALNVRINEMLEQPWWFGREH